MSSPNVAAASTSNSNIHQSPSSDRIDKEELWRWLPLYRTLLRNNERGPEQSFVAFGEFRLLPSQSFNQLKSMKITGARDTILHLIVGAGKWSHYQKIHPAEIAPVLTLRNRDGHTPLCVAAMVGNMKAARGLLEFEMSLPLTQRASMAADGPYPVIEAARYGHKEMVLLLIGEMNKKMEGSPPTKQSIASLFLHLLVVAEFYDVLLALVRRNRCLAWAEFYGDNNESLLSLMAGKPSAFRSGTQLSFWQKLLYSVIHANLRIRLADIEKSLVVVQNSAILLPPMSSTQPANGLPSTQPANGLRTDWLCNCIMAILAYLARKIYSCLCNCIMAILAYLARKIYSCLNHIGIVRIMRKTTIYTIHAAREIWKTATTPIRHIKDTKLMHEEALDIVKCLCEELMKRYHAEDVEPVLKTALLTAASSGASEIIEEIIEHYPDAIWFVDSENHNLFHLAVINRHEKVFNLIYQLSLYKHLVIADEDTSGNNILHMAGKLAPLGRLNLISGAALQMQRELQWYQEVEKFVQPTFRTKKNSYGKTPKMVFTEEHKELVKEGEKWMKETATSCIFVASLTATVGFAAAITVPGGNNQNSGFPLFSNEAAFTVFAVSVAFCLFSSVASVLMFLSILTSRYAEDDFLRRLPKRLFLGLGMLFVSMTSLMIAFGATIYLVFGQKKGWILIPVGMAALMPVILFESLQSPLLLDMFMSTYGPSIFRKQGSRLLY